MKSIRFAVALSIVACALVGGAAVAGGQPIPHPGAPSPQRAVAQEWVRYINSGDQRDACALQTVGEVNGRSCGALPTRQVLRCPKGAVVRKPSASEVLRPYEQVGTITEEGANRAFAVLHSQWKTSRVKGALGLEQHGGTWQVSYLRQGGNTYTSAGTVWMTEVWRRLWYPPTCSR